MQKSNAWIVLLGLALPIPLGASPVTSSSTSPQCSAVSKIVSVLHAYSLATPFCSGYLHISTATSTVTATVNNQNTQSTLVTGKPVTITASPVTVTVSSVVSATNCATAARVQKRKVTTSSSKSSSTTSAKGTTTLAKPTSTSSPLPSCVASYPTSQISSACSCLSIPTPSVTQTVSTTAKNTVYVTSTVISTVTITPTVTSTATITSTVQSCPSATATNCNPGVQFAYFENQSGSKEDDAYSQFEPATYKTATPRYQSTTNYFGFDYPRGDDTQQVYDLTIGAGQSLGYGFFVLNHRGYLYVNVTGPYSFTGGGDDFGEIWTGPVAYSGWNRANGFILSNTPTTINLVANTYTPFRAIYANAQGGGFFQLDIRGPDGAYVEYGLGVERAGPPYTQPDLLQQYSCDGVVAPQYPAYGSET